MEYFYTRKEISEILKISEKTVDKLIKSGQLEAFKLGDGSRSSIRISEKSFKKFLEQSKIKSNG